MNIEIIAMKLPTVDKFLFYFTLETGAMILAGLSITASVAVVSVATSFLVRYINFYHTLTEQDQDFFRQFLIGDLRILKFVRNRF